MANIELKFPVFAFMKNDYMIYTYFNDFSLKSTSTELLRKNAFRDDYIVDSSGNIYRIARKFMVKYRGIWGFSLVYKGRQILVDYEYKPEINTITLEDFKKDIIQRVNKTKRIWASAWDIKELIEEINKASSFSEIAMFLK